MLSRVGFGKFAQGLGAAVVLLYPVWVFFSLRHLGTLWTVLGALALVAPAIVLRLRAGLARKNHQNREDREEPRNRGASSSRREYRVSFQDSKKPHDFGERVRFAESGDVSGLVRSRSFALVALLPMVAIVIAALAAMLGAPDAALSMPVLTSVGFLLLFLATLYFPPPMIERFARRIDGDLRSAEVAWCRLWTWIWCAYFAANALICLMLARFAPLFWWTFYTSLLNYLVMGVLFAAEWVLRKWRFRRFKRQRMLDRLVLALFQKIGGHGERRPRLPPTPCGFDNIRDHARAKGDEM